MPAKTLRIQSKGTARISPDLVAIAKSFTYTVDRKKKTLWLDGSGTDSGPRLHVWKSGRAKSGSIAVVSLMEELGLDPEVLYGNSYDVIVNGKLLEVRFK